VVTNEKQQNTATTSKARMWKRFGSGSQISTKQEHRALMRTMPHLALSAGGTSGWFVFAAE